MKCVKGSMECDGAFACDGKTVCVDCAEYHDANIDDAHRNCACYECRAWRENNGIKKGLN